MEHFLQGNVPISHMLNAKPPFMYWHISAFNEVNDWAPSIEWEKSINTEINPGDKFEDALKDLDVYTESDENGKGKSFLKWQHTLNYGLDRYAIADFTKFLFLSTYISIISCLFTFF